ncbi:hypothetical protein FIU87_19810 [Bacillus sp. THAF10]|uniref:hypothetical protein n=1 Tax=Bacillus sp. THAF10 TaxID=2587848 RepID=UPI0012AA5231|nr:hypothetical protein [Bacillus sp. THAF10]QFT90896.1 hypothetical protein FIU87_19810 [Bacillus sp. THAF10]
MILKTILAITLMFNVSVYANGEYAPPSPKIVQFYTSIPEKDNWVTVPEGTKEITINVEALNTETVLFWLIPTGTQTWYERKLIGYDIKDDKDNKFSLTWKVPKHLHDHIQVQALGENEIAGSSLNITSNP